MGALLFPLLSFFILSLGRQLHALTCSTIGIGSLALSTVTSIITAQEVYQQKTIIYSYNWIQLEGIDLQLKFIFDELSTAMSILVSLITMAVLIYSRGYIETELVKFYSYIIFFCFSMLFFVTGGNYVTMFIGWESVGLASYLLISFWTARNDANISGLKAVTINRVGDVFFLLALALMYVFFKTWDFSILSLCIYNEDSFPVFLIALFLVIAAFCKSAQFLAHTWLADAMEGPTPVSSLLHPATMVTAGLFLLLRSTFLLPQSILYGIGVWGLVSLLCAGVLALTPYDIKKIVAYSTASQLGFLTLSIGFGGYAIAFFHILTHAFFKNVLFLSCGSLIHAENNEQDLRRMGNLAQRLPLTFICFLLCSLALIGFPAFSGFFSKDLLLEGILSMNATFFVLGCCGALLTAIYSTRLLYLAFFSENRAEKKIVESISEPTIFMLLPMILFSMFAVISGYILKDIFTGFSAAYFWRCFPVQLSLGSAIVLDLEFEDNLWLKLLPTLVGFLGVGLTVLFFSHKRMFLFLYPAHNLSAQKLYIDSIQNFIFAKFALYFGYIQYKIIDRGFLESVGPTGATRILDFARRIHKVINGFLIDYIQIIFVMLVTLFLITL